MRKLILSLLAFFLITPAFADVLTVYPDAGTGSTTVDGILFRVTGSETFSTIRAGAGTLNQTTGTTGNAARLSASTTTNQFDVLTRGIFTFDTSSLTAGATISSAIFSLYGQAKSNGNGSDSIEVVASTPAADNNLQNSDYSQLGSTSFGSIDYASYSTIAYNDFTLDSNGIANISKTGISKFGTRLGWDVSGTFGGSWASGGETLLNCYLADQTGTSQDPKLVITYTTASESTGNFFQILDN